MRATGIEVADIFRQAGQAYRQQHADTLNHEQRRVMGAIESCRTAALGGHVEQCDVCGHQRIAYNSCRNRHCPKCQSLTRAQWLEDRQADLLPVEYFHVVFTLPEEIAAIAYQNKAVVYDLLFHATAETLQTIAADPKHLGAEIGFIAILHTWGQNLLHHPHLHCVVPGGGLSADGERWISCRPGICISSITLKRCGLLLPSPAIWPHYGGPSGWFTPSPRLAAPSMSLNISAAIRIGLPSPTIV